MFLSRPVALLRCPPALWHVGLPVLVAAGLTKPAKRRGLTSVRGAAAGLAGPRGPFGVTSLLPQPAPWDRGFCPRAEVLLETLP